jgi:DNA-binding NarL/FixJ family response regulator
MSELTRILIADDQSLFREGLHTLLSVQPEFEVIGEAGNGEEVLRMVSEEIPDVVLMDLRMPGMDGVSATHQLHEKFPDVKVIVLTTFDDDEDVFEGLRAGAVGYLLKDVPSSMLYEAIRAAAKGEYFLLPSITAKIVSELKRVSAPGSKNIELVDPLSAREMEVLRLVSNAMSNKEIAETLVISEGTVKNHLSSILAKLSARDRIQAVEIARRIGLI